MQSRHTNSQHRIVWNWDGAVCKKLIGVARCAEVQ